MAGFQGKNIVLVEDEDGFQVPTAINDVVVVESDNYDLAHVVQKKMAAGTDSSRQTAAQQQLPPPTTSESSYPRIIPAPPVERKGGDRLSVWLAFVPIDIHEMTTTRFELFLVNDSNYYLRYVLLTAEGNAWQVRATAEVEPNTKLFIEELDRQQIASNTHIAVQAIAYKRDKPFLWKSPVEVHFRIDPVKFYKLHAFRENAFFETPAILYAIVENDQPSNPQSISVSSSTSPHHDGTSAPATPNLRTPAPQKADYVRRYDDGKHKGNPFAIKHKGDDDVLVVDLHASELLTTTKGMTPGDILDYQIGVVRRTLNEHAAEKGRRIVFIHGKGEGVLRRAVIHELNYRYKSYTYQDASFQEYGYGATQVTIR